MVMKLFVSNDLVILAAALPKTLKTEEVSNNILPFKTEIRCAKKPLDSSSAKKSHCSILKLKTLQTEVLNQS